MQNIQHLRIDTSAATGKRIGAFSLALALQGAMVLAFVEGLDIKAWPKTMIDRTVSILPKTDETLPPPPPPQNWTEPAVSTPIAPIFKVEDGPSTQAITLPATHATPTETTVVRAAESIVATHTIPPYPALSLRLGEEGVVQLRLTISAEGRVVAAAVVRTSGSEALDAAAQAWIVAHWRYRPAVAAGGEAVASQATVAVRFDLKNAP